MPVYVRASNRDTWHWCFNCSRYPWGAAQAGAIFGTGRPRRDLCKECLRMERRGTCRY
jgi:hypothetical protein